MFINEKVNIKSAAKNKIGGAMISVKLRSMISVKLRRMTIASTSDNSSPATTYSIKTGLLKLTINQNKLAENTIAAKSIERTVCIGDIRISPLVVNPTEKYTRHFILVKCFASAVQAGRSSKVLLQKIRRCIIFRQSSNVEATHARYQIQDTLYLNHATRTN